MEPASPAPRFGAKRTTCLTTGVPRSTMTDHLYGMFSFKKYGNGPLQCVELKSGKIKWSQDGYGPGNVILSGDHLIALADDGDLSLVKATPSKYTELARKKVLEWKMLEHSHPE